MSNPYKKYHKTRAERGLSPYAGIKKSPADQSAPISSTIKNVDGKPKVVTTGGSDWQKLQRESREKKQANSLNPRRGGAGFGQ